MHRFDAGDRIILVAFLLCCAAGGNAQDSSHLKLWYDHPAGTVWEAALPVGNGRLAAMVYGNTDKEILQLNESSIWSGGPNRNDNPHALAALPEIRKRIFQNDPVGASDLAAKNIQSERINGMEFQPAGNLELSFPGMEQADHYYRELDLEKAIATTVFTVKGIRYTREVFASIPDQVIVMRLTADHPGSLNFSASFTSPQRSQVFTESIAAGGTAGSGARADAGADGAAAGADGAGAGAGTGVGATAEPRAAGRELILSGISGDKDGVPGQVKFRSVLRIRNRGGKLVAGEKELQVSGADEVVLIISIASNFVNYHDLSADEKARAEAYLNGAGAKDFAGLLRDHLRVYQTYFNRVHLDLGITEAAQRPTDERIRTFDSTDDPQLVALYFQFGRYLLISSSEPGGQPANLQGIWNNKIHPPWGSKYTININTEMNYWPGEETNLAEMHEPLIQMVKDLSQTGQETAKVMYGAGGWVAHHNTDLWRITGPVDGIYSAMWPMGGAWLSEDLWRKYLYGGDKVYLGSVYPALKGAAQFCLDFLVEEPSHHWLVIAPSMSPENNPKNSNGKSISAGVTIDNQLLFELFSNLIRAAGILHVDSHFADQVRAARQRLPPMQIGQYGQLQEWLQDLDDPKDKNRHVSHLFGVYPGSQISPYRTPELFSAAHTSLIFRGDISTGWSMAWKVNLWARFLDGNHAYQLIRNQLTPAGVNKGAANSGGGTYPNLFDAHPPFQIDGNFGCTAGIAEMLLQCYDGDIYVLPALPDAWKTGRVDGLRAIGGFTIREMEWKEGRLTRLVIRSELGGNCRIRVRGGLELAGKSLKPAAGVNPNPFYAIDETPRPLVNSRIALSKPELAPTNLYDLDTAPGKEYILTATN